MKLNMLKSQLQKVDLVMKHFGESNLVEESAREAL